jgi:valyl-tRNA synthetase
MKEIPKLYNPKEVETKIYKFWEKTGFFNPDRLPKPYTLNAKPYSIVIPPPNITGSLHMGHALNCVIQDILIRKKRMEGFRTLWLPGTDHAGIATQYVVEKELKKEGKTRFDLGREKFIERIWQWVEKYGGIILEQFKKLGCSLDWSRKRFTLDKEYVKAVETAFWHYYKKGLIYQGERVVNWCPRCKTSLSDLEIEYEEEKGNLWYIKYPIKSQNSKVKSQNYIVVATTRPETMLGDSAVAVNPKDERYKDFVGKKVILPLVGREIPIIADNLVDKNFGTGAVKITPAHDLKDYEISKRHNLKIYKVIDENERITNLAPEKYKGLSIFEAREKIVDDLKEQGFLEKIEDFWHSVPKCYRCKTKIEFLPMKQWFLKMEGLAKTAIDVVKSQKVKFFPKRFEKIYFDWLKNTKDWCISRQIWWGHKIPIEGEEDVLDTWFSSALWPFAALGWPEKKVKSQKSKVKSDLDRFYPTDVLSTGRDIINLWVARMIFSGMEFMKKPPFKIVLIHPTVLTKEGKRMSKSLGTGADPMEFIEKYGADATRFGIIWQVMGNQDLRFTEDHIKMGQKFCNKVWNASRFVLLKIQNSKIKIQNENLKLKKKKLGKDDKKILKALNKTIKSVNKSLENFQFGKAAHSIYNFFWHNFCDKYLEEFKIQNSKVKSQKVLLSVLLTSLKLLHPFIPFITEEIYQILPIKNKKRSLMIEKWPKQI